MKRTKSVNLGLWLVACVIVVCVSRLSLSEDSTAQSSPEESAVAEVDVVTEVDAETVLGAASEADAETVQGAASEAVTLSPASFTNSLGMQFNLIPAGSFMMGSPESEENRDDGETQHEVTLTQSFYIGVYEVTQSEWLSVMGTSIEDQRDKADSDSLYGTGDRYPMYYVSWEDCQQFIGKLNDQYGSELRQKLGEGWSYSLPSEAQWEYACRAGTTGAYGGSGDLAAMGWYNSREAHKVGGKDANQLGLYDMHGNVWEWCRDWYDDYPTERVTDPTGPTSGSTRIFRGGGWGGNVRVCRSAYRDRAYPTNRFYHLGCRVALVRASEQDLQERIATGPTSLVDPGDGDDPSTSPASDDRLAITNKSFTNSLGMQFNLIPAGSFMMGSPESEEGRFDDETQHKVTLTQPFYIGVYEVTQSEWLSVMGSCIEEQIEEQRDKTNPDWSLCGAGDRFPMCYVSWEDCQAFIRKLNSQYGGELRRELGTGWVYRLPSEAQWEYACRAGTTGTYGGSGELDSMGWCSCNSGGKMHEVGNKEANGFGLYDMHGNVWEWCGDWSDAYPDGSVTDPTGPTSGSARVGRGGGWVFLARYCRSANRNRYAPTDRSLFLGCRVALVRASEQDLQERIATGPTSLVDPGDGDDPSTSPASDGQLSITNKSFTNSLGMQFNLIPAGTFTMGSPESEENRDDGETQHEVTLTQSFYIGVYEVTQSEWLSVMGENPSGFSAGGVQSGDVFGLDTTRFPVEGVSWYDCQVFIRKLNSQYGTELQRELGTGWSYSLPTEAQWEYACRAGTTTPYSFGGTLNGDKANCDGEYPYGMATKGRNLKRTTTVGAYSPNSWGVYDMHGNVLEWCSDRYDDAYPTGSVTDPTGPTSGSFRVNRGGCWLSYAEYCRSAYRRGYAPTRRISFLGCRVALVRASERSPTVATPASDLDTPAELAAAPERIDPEGENQETGTPSSSPTTGKSFTNSLGMQFNLIPAGTFTMGSSTSEKARDDDETQHEVTLTQSFYMGVYEVTQGEWMSVMGTSIEEQRDKVNPDWSLCGTGDRFPMYYVSWVDCQDFVRKLNSLYGTELQRELGEGWSYCLPSESQWEYACRAGTTTPYSFGRTLNGDKANCNGNYPYGTQTKGRYLERTTTVGAYSPNSWGLCDMHGSVWEWCCDGYDAYPTGSVTDPTGPTSGSYRVIRGGSWFFHAEYCRSAYRGRNAPTIRDGFLGCRVALVRASQ